VKISLESPFEKAGLKMGDVIVGVNGARVSDIGALSKIIGYRRDQILNILVNRDNKIIEFQLSL
jgi:S1-C subfamily serine protease